MRREHCLLPVARRIRLQRAVTLAVLLIGLLSGTLGLGYAYWHAKQTRRTTTGIYFQELARQSADKVALALAKEVEWVERLAALSEVREAVHEGVQLNLGKPELQRWREAQHEYFRSLAIVDRRGNLIGGVTSEVTRVHYAQQPWWPVVFGQGRSWSGDLRVDKHNGGYWEVAVPIRSDDGTVRGALKVAIGTGQLFASILRTRIGQTGHVMVLGDDGRVLICPVFPPGLHTKTDAFSGGLHPIPSVLSEATWAEVQDDTHGVHGNIVGIAPVVLPNPIAQEHVWQILLRQDPKETYEPARVLMWKLAGFWIGTFGFIALLGWRLARRIVRPIETLVEKVRMLGEGQPTVPLKVDGPPPKVAIIEIETLASSFHNLGEQLEAASRQTQRYVTELEAANRELRSSEEHYRTLWNHAVDAKLIVNAGGTVLDVNRRAELKLGRRAEELVGMTAVDLFLDRDRPRFEELLRQVLATGKEETAVDLHVPTTVGGTLTIELDMVPVEKAGIKSDVLLQLNDITDKKLLEQQLLRSERLASLSQFASMFAHDIRNPLAGIKKTLEVLHHHQELQAEPVSRLFGDLQLTTELLLGMINDMLDVYQESYSGLPLVSSPFSVRRLLQDVVHLFGSEAEAKGITIRLELPEDEIILAADRRRLQRVWVNLVHNALKYSSPDSRITISAGLERAGTLDAACAVDEPVLLVQVEDEGPGVAPEDLPHLFEMFFRKKDGHDLRIGRGLGLHYCRLVVEAHRGHIWAANRPAGGAVFSVMLPWEPTGHADQTRDSRRSATLPSEPPAPARTGT